MMCTRYIATLTIPWWRRLEAHCLAGKEWPWSFAAVVSSTTLVGLGGQAHIIAPAANAFRVTHPLS